MNMDSEFYNLYNGALFSKKGAERSRNETYEKLN